MNVALIDALHAQVACLATPGFFVTAECAAQGEVLPHDIDKFILQKYKAIVAGMPGRRFSFRAEGWSIYVTFFPTDRVVDERYALKNKTSFRHRKL